MTICRSRLPFSLDPLIAEAKRRMRRRRLLSAAMALLLAGSALGATLTLSRPTPPEGSAFSLSPAKARVPLSNLATRMAFCGNRYSTCHSPDGRWSIVYVNRSAGPVSYTYTNGHASGLPTTKVGCTFIVTRLATGQRQRIHSGTSCNDGIWIGHQYVVLDPYPANPGLGRVVSIDPPSRHVKTLVKFSAYVVSPNGHWIAGETGRFDGGAGTRPIAVQSLTNHTCRIVAGAEGANHLSVDRSPWEFPPFPSRGWRDPVVWHTKAQGGKKIRFVSGPGTGFTRDSRSIIVAEWQEPSRSNWGKMAIHKRLVKFDLSSLHTPCPAGVAPRS